MAEIKTTSGKITESPINVTDNGNVGIRTTNPEALVDILAPSLTHTVIRITATSSGFNSVTRYAIAGVNKISTGLNQSIGDDASYEIYDSAGNKSLAFFKANGNVGIGTISPTSGYKLDVIGDIRCQALTQYSDGNLKENVNDLNLGLDFVKRLRPVSYKWKNKEEVKELQEVEEDVFEEKEIGYEEVTIKEVDGKYVQVKETKTRIEKVPVYDEFDLYDEQGNIIGKHQVQRKQKVSKEVVKKSAETYSRQHFGLIAQEVETLLNTLGISTKDFGALKITNYGKEGEHIYGIDYTQLIAILIKAIQELANKIGA